MCYVIAERLTFKRSSRAVEEEGVESVQCNDAVSVKAEGGRAFKFRECVYKYL